jgi:hypothetical protein
MLHWLWLGLGLGLGLGLWHSIALDAWLTDVVTTMEDGLAVC